MRCFIDCHNVRSVAWVSIILDAASYAHFEADGVGSLFRRCGPGEAKTGLPKKTPDPLNVPPGCIAAEHGEAALIKIK